MGAIPQELLNPPSNLLPAEAGFLLAQGEGGLLLATLLDLARRGHLRISQNTSKKFLDPSFQFERTNSTDALQPFEQLFLNDLFQNQPAITSNAGRLFKLAPPLRQRVQQRLINSGFFDQSKQAVIRQGVMICIPCMILGAIGILGTASSTDQASVWLASIGAIFFVMGLVWIGSALLRQGVSVRGATERAHWQAFQKAVATVKQSGLQFEALLPYAAAFYQGERLTYLYSSDFSTPLPAWFVPYLTEQRHLAMLNQGQTNFPLQDFSENFVSMLTTLNMTPKRRRHQW